LFTVKICGVTRVADAQLAALAGADAIGLNFYDKSSRHIEIATAVKICSVVPSRVSRVGVFVNSPLEVVEQLSAQLSLDWIQLHGDESPEFVSALGSRPIIRAFRFGQSGAEEIQEYLDACRQHDRLPDAILVDASQGDQYGGTGQTLDWSAVNGSRHVFGDLPWILAGGLTPFNVADAIRAARPNAVDVASGVETKPPAKDAILVRAFLNAAKKAFGALEASGS
jgi:phosphoribosylanthranilate isomerase